MDTPAHNKLNTAGKSHIKTIGDLRDFIRVCDLPTTKKSPIMSALKIADRLVGHGALDLPADAALILQRLDGLSPAMAGMSRGALANLKSRVREAFRLAEPRLEKSKPSARPPLSEAWLTFQSRLPKATKFSLSRIIHYANSQGWVPEEISDEHLGQFASHLRTEALVVKWFGTVRGTVKAWNGLPDEIGLQIKLLTPPPRKREAYWINVEQWPERLRGDVDAFLQYLGQPSSFAGKKVRKLKKTTVDQYRYAITTLVSAVAAGGTRLDVLETLREVVTINHLDAALMFLHARAGGKVTNQMFQLALKTRTAAAWCGADDKLRGEFDDICKHLRLRLPKKGMTPKNRSLLDKLDDQRFLDLVHLLPALILEKVGKVQRRSSCREWGAGRKISDARLAGLVRVAVAIELLLVCGLRRENLVSLELDKTIRKIGQPPKAVWVIDLEGDEVKNEEPLRFTLPQDTAELFEAYLTKWRPLLCECPSAWVFPASDGTRMDPKSLADAIARVAKNILGVRITPHQFRHLSAELYLRENPEGLFTIGQHLGHRDPNTTRTYYARPKQREASRRYQDEVVLRREEASRRQRSRRPRGGDRQ